MQNIPYPYPLYFRHPYSPSIYHFLVIGNTVSGKIIATNQGKSETPEASAFRGLVELTAGIEPATYALRI